MVRGDLDDEASLTAAVRGTDGVFAITDFWEHGYEGQVRHGRNIVDVAQKAGIRQLVYSSVASADRNTGIPHFDSKHEVESYIRKSGINYTIIRPVSFMQNWAGARSMIETQGLQTPQKSQSKTWLISTRDIGRFATQAFDDPQQWLGVELDIAGDEFTSARRLAIVGRHAETVIGHVQRQVPSHDRQADHAHVGPRSGPTVPHFGRHVLDSRSCQG